MTPIRPNAVRLCLALLALSVAWPADAQRRRDRRAPQPDRRVVQPDNDDNDAGPPPVCLSDQFFVHVPTWASPASLPASFRNDLKAAMAGHVSGVGGLAGVAVDVAPVLDPRPTIAQRADGHRRFWTVKTSEDIPPGELCGWLGALRTKASALAGAPVYIGRECVAGALADPGAADWPLEVMGVPGPIRGVPAPVAIVDSGFKASPDWTAPGATGTPHPHGAMIEGVIQQLTASATTPALLDYRVLDHDGRAPLAEVAAAIDAAVFAARGPIVINLSLGWPPELERRRAVDGCAELEDPAGEAVRYALAMAQLRDAGLLTGGPGDEGLEGPTAVSMAAGNRPELFGQDVTPYYAAHFAVDTSPLSGDCAQPSGDGLFYPAQWARRRTCLNLGGSTLNVRPRMTAVGATDHRDQRSPLSSQEMTPLLVAPGVGVRMAGERWSGSSVSAAYASAALALEMAGGGSGADAAAVLLGRAVALPHVRSRFTPKRLAFPGAHAAGAPLYSAPGRTISGASAAPITGRDRVQCMRTLGRWIKGAAPRSAVAAACPAFLSGLDRASSGAAGPQPLTTGCPECYAVIDPRDAKGDLHVTLADDWSPTPTLGEPHLVINWPDGYESWIPLPGGASWAPGASFTVTDIPIEHPQKKSSAQDLIDKGALSLVMEVTQWGKASIDVSVVTIKP